MSIQLIAVDIDGTLLTPERVITQNVQKTIEEAKIKGVKVVLCTGRPLAGVIDYLNALNLTEKGDYVLTYNGALAQEADTGNVLAHHTMSMTDFYEVEEMSRKIGVHLHTTTRDAIYTANRNIGEYTVREAFIVSLPLKYRTIEEMDQNLMISKMMMIDEPSILEKGIELLPNWFFEKYTILRSEPFFLEILNKEASKGQALKHLTNLLGLSAAEVMAIGDNENDIDMIEYAGIGVAMGNAVPKVKAVANVITGTNAEDGVASIIREHL